ncbi:hypothetical protein ILUMI_08477 [Ignelater luminosus]|uniref:Uncharacterized protein n=1 Tax=Ignelater luminosus TaxID=2038154 RepID=A0A8K0GDD3_IGNLU|nr:hypothetical protein ILUMI_08477 [Ignelater luminosus]
MSFLPPARTEIHEELLFARIFTTDTKSKSIFNVLKDYFMEKAIPLSNIISVATDGAPAMFGRYRGFISHLKQNVSVVLAIHCVIHRQHLVAKNLNNKLPGGNVSTYVQHLNAFYADFETRLEDILTLVIPQWITNPYGDIEETDVILQEELIGISTNEELKVQFRKGYQQFSLQKDILLLIPYYGIVSEPHIWKVTESNYDSGILPKDWWKAYCENSFLSQISQKVLSLLASFAATERTLIAQFHTEQTKKSSHK